MNNNSKINLAFFSTKQYDSQFFDKHFKEFNIECNYFESKLNKNTAKLAKGFNSVCAFVNDEVNKEVIFKLKENGVKLIALRSAGFNHVDLKAAKEANITVVRVPEYSPNAVAEHTLALLLGVNRKIYKAYNRVREGNFELNGLIGFDLCNKTVGIIGSGKIGSAVTKIFLGFGCKVLVSDPALEIGVKNDGSEVVKIDTLIESSNIITLHCPLNKHTHHLINKEQIEKMKENVVIVNTSRGGLIDTQAVISALKSGKISSFAIDVYEEEEDLFFENLSNNVIQDDTFARLLTFPNVLVTGHQAFFTSDALNAIAEVTTSNIYTFFKKDLCENSVSI